MNTEWIAAVSAELGVSPDVAVDAILDVARVAAHEIERPAAPVTTYLLGQAVAAGMPIDDAVARITALADGWASDEGHA